MLIFPIGHESNTVRRLPWITITIMAICLVVHIFVSISMNNVEKRLENAAMEFVEYFLSHPYLEFDPDLKEMIFGELYNEQFEAMLEAYRMQYPPPTFTFERDEEQERLNNLSQKFKNALNSVPYRKYGFIPARKTMTGLFAYMFIHGGWLHLLGNLFFLYLTGPFIEDKWGRPLYAVFYVTVGVLSAVMFAIHYPKLVGPLIGASGAIAGVMGAFLIRFWDTKINFFYFFIFARGTFQAPAWLMLPLWAVLELFNARMVDSISPETGGGVAHWAHVWGFVFGVGIALVLKFNRVEERHIAPKIEKQISYVNDVYQALEEATVLKRRGDFDKAFSLLLTAVESDPTNDDIVGGLWNLGVELDRIDETSDYMIKLIEREIRRNQMEQALNHYRKLRERIPKPPLSMPYKIKILEILAKQKNPIEADSLAAEMLKKMDVSSPPLLVLNFARIAPSLDSRVAKKVYELCLKHPEIPDLDKEEIKEKLNELKAKVRFDFDEASGQYSSVQTQQKAPEDAEPDEDGVDASPSADDAVFDVLQPEKDVGMAIPEEISFEPKKAPKDKKDDRLSAYLSFNEKVGTAEAQTETSGKESKMDQISEATTGMPGERVEPADLDHQGESTKEIAGTEKEAFPQFPGMEDSYQSYPGLGGEGTAPQFQSEAKEQKPDSAQEQPDDHTIRGQKEKGEYLKEEKKIAEKISSPTPLPEKPVPKTIEPKLKSPASMSKKAKPREDETYFAPIHKKTLKMIKANIKEIKGDKLSIDAMKLGPRLLPLNKVKTIVVAEINSPYEPSYYLIDLFLDDLKSNLSTIRSIRLFSSAFDPVRFFPDTKDTKEALKAFISFLLKTSKATPIPDEPAVLLERPQKYFFIEDYEDFILS
ncbi:MAG: rhomboid family intramembrane serine protease [Candidatus Aminicenantes bacterium]|nr:rhomboid family intramembrane serine protease [Candidatus Aminicenantes bacterium]